jgi:putative transposase
MPEYRRHRVAGGTTFFTVSLADRNSDPLVREVSARRGAVARARTRHPFRVGAWTVLPDHMHAIWTLPSGNADFSIRWSLIKHWWWGEEHPTLRATLQNRA